jgi:imidazoleglycerol-phosphate dehydratase
VDDHHTVEDVGIVLGQAFAKALGDYAGIRRFGQAGAPMEEALARVDVDLSRRPYLVYEAPIESAAKVGGFDAQLAEEFWRAFSIHGGANMHIEVIRGKNLHHILEAVFKAAGRALDQAVGFEPRAQGALSTKGAL